MREKLNDNPLAQVGILAVLLVSAGFFVLSSMGGGGEEDEAPSAETSTALTTPEGSVAVTSAGGAPAPVASPPPGALADTAPPPPRAVTDAFSAGQTVVLLFVRDSGIDDRIVNAAVDRLDSMGGVATFVVPAKRIARYATIAQGVDVNRVPALVVIRPKRLGHGIATAFVRHGFQSSQSVVQAVIDAGYKGRTVDYHP